MENRKRQLMVLICFLAVFVSGICMMKMDTLAATSQKSFWDVEDINPVSNPASENWLTTLIAKQIVGSPKPTPSQLTQEQFDSIETLVIKTVPGSGKTPWEAPKELANLRNLKEIEFQALTSESVFNNTPNEMFEIPSLKKLKITYYKGNFPAKLCLATQIEELELLNGSGTLGSSKQTVIPQEFGNLVNLRRLNIQETVSNLSFPASIGNLVNLQSIEISDGEGVIFPDEIGKLQQLEIFNTANVVMDEFPAGLTNCKNLKELSLYGRNYTEIPEQISDLANLERLELLFLPTGCRIPDSIGQLTKLKYLSTYSVYYNDLDKEVGITQLPESIGNCTELEELNLTGASITSLPKSITKLKKLTKLDLSQCLNLKSLPADIGELTGLTQLDLEVVLPNIGQISTLPDSIVNLTNLTELKAGQQQLKKLPEQIGKMIGLTAIYVEGNQLTRLPDSIGQLKNLGILQAQRNNLVEIPASIGNLCLGQLFLQGNQLTSLPEEISGLDGSSWMGQVAIDLSNNKFRTVPDISLFKKATVASLDLSNCEIEELGDWTQEDGRPGALNGFYANQRVGVSVNLSGNRILNIPESWEGKVVPSSTVLKGQTTKVTAQYNPSTKKAVLTNPLQYHGGKLPIDKYTISGGGKYDYNAYTFTWDNAKPGDMYTITFDAKSIYNSQGEKLSQYSGTLYVSVGEGIETGHTLKLTARNAKGEDITSQWPQSFKSSYKVFPDETIQFKLPGISGYTLAAPSGEFVQGTGSISAADGYIKISKITQNSEVVFHYAKGLHRIQVVPVEDGTTTDLTGLAEDPNYQFNYEVEENGSITIHAPQIKGYTIKGESQITLEGVTSDRIVKFTYTRNQVEEKVNISIWVEDRDGKDLSALVDQSVTPLKREVAKGSNVRVEAPVISGYKIHGDTFQEYNPITQDVEVTFTYKKDLQVTIHVEDSDGNDLSKLVNQETNPLVISVSKGDNVKVEAPVISGYKIDGDSFKEYNPITQDVEVTFTYKKDLQVTIHVEDSDGNDLSKLVNQETNPLVISVSKGDNVKVEAPVISGYKIDGDSFKEYNPITQDVEVTFTYKKDLQVTIHVKDSDGNDLSKLVNQETNPLVIPVSKGDNVKVEAPVISGYKIDGDSFKEYNPITKDEEVTFTYKKDLQVTIYVKDSDGNDLSKLVNQETNPLVISVSKGDNVKVEAPVISGYKIDGDSIKEFNPITQNEQVTFTYKKQLQVTILVKDSKGKDLSSLVNQEANPLVLPVLKGDNVRVEAPVITGYKLQGENFKEFRPITTNETVEFIYQEEIKPIEKVTVTIHVKDTAGKDLSKLVDQNVNPLTIQVEKGSDVTVEAPVIEGYKLQGHSQIGFYPIGKDESVEFIYKEEVKPAEKVTVTIQTLDTDGIDLNSLVNTEESPLIWEAEKGSNVKVEAPVIEGYIVQGESTKEFSPIQQNEHIVFTYAKEIKPVEKVNITIIPRDEQDNDLSSLVNQEESPLFMTVEKNSNVIVSAPVIEGYKIQGYSYQEFYPILQDETVIFTYKETVKPVEKVNISILLRDDTGKDLSSLIDQEIYPLVRTAEKGSNVRIEYPEIEGYEIQGESVKEFIPILQNEEITFNYHKKEKPVEKVSVTIHVMDEKGKDLSSLVDQSAEPLVVEAEKGSEVRIEAPAINGYEVIGEGVQMFYPIIRDEIVKFVYKEKEKPVEKVKVRILVKDENGRDLAALVDQSVSPLEIESVKGESVKIWAPDIDGYYVYGSDHYEFSPITGDQTVTFCYKQKIIPAEKVKIYVKVFDDNDRDISSLVDQSVTKLVYEVNKGSSITINAPAIKGYEVISQSKIQLQNVRYDQSAVFYYRKVKEKPKNPKLVLKQDRIEIFVGDNLQLEQMVSLATDSSNQDLRSKLRYSVFPSYLIEGQVFCSPIKGEFRVAITLPHEAGNVTKYLYVKVKERPKPDYAKLTLKKSKATMKVGKKLNLRDLISVAQDSNGKNIKDKVTFSAKNKKMIKKNYFVASKTGTFNVTFKMPYQKGTLTKELKVVVKPASPVLRLKKTEITVKSGETVNMKQYIKEALQYKGGKNAIKLVKCRVGSENLSKNMKFTASKAGKYKVMYSLTNKYGITVKKSMNMIVKAKKQLPVLELSTDNLSITPGKRVYLKDFIKTASDDKDGPNLKSKVICTLNGERLLGDTFYSYNTGSFTILYRLTNQAGQTAMAQLEINVKPWRN